MEQDNKQVFNVNLEEVASILSGKLANAEVESAKFQSVISELLTKNKELEDTIRELKAEK